MKASTSARSSNKIRDTQADRLFVLGIYSFLSIVLIIVLYPLIYIVSSSFSSPQAVISGRVWLWPVEPSLRGYEAVFNSPAIVKGYMNSAFYTFAGTLVNVVMTVAIAYPLSKATFYGRNVLMVLLLITMLFSGGLIPYYLTVKALSLLDTPWAMIIPQALAVWQVFIAKTFFQESIPSELAEAAELDGCSDMGFLMKVVVPLSKPILAVLVLMYGVGHWNAYFDALIFLKSPDLYPLQIILRNILILNSTDQDMMVDATTMAARQGMKDLLKFSLIVVACLPMLILYPFIQKYFVKGVMIGALKG
jgi:putative aldouronate transport system permease protein